MSYIHLDLLIRLIAAHAISDFILQPSKWVDHRKKKKIKSVYLYLHTLITGLLAWLALGSWTPVWIPLAITISHLAIDLGKSYIKKENATLFFVDQGLHLIIIAACWFVYTKQFPVLSANLIYQFTNLKTLLIVTGYILVTLPSSILVMRLTEKWGKALNGKANENDDSLENAGKWIGVIERILVLTFTFAGKYEAIGFLLAAKSVFRFGDLKEAKDRKRTEYILIGTLLSFSVSILLGLLILKLM